jgi:hypothetical protein
MADVSTPRALRKQVLLLRSAAERAELVRQLGDVQRAVPDVGKLMPALALGRGLPLALGLLKRGSLLSPLLSLVLSGARRPMLRYAALAAGAAWLGWKGWQVLASASGQDAPE